MYPGRYFMMPTAFNGNYMIPRNMGLLDKVFKGFKKFNWRGLLSGTSKTLTTINQTIPIIKEMKPAFNNVRSIVQLTRAFSKETKTNSNKNINNPIKEKLSSAKITDDAPTFFI